MHPEAYSGMDNLLRRYAHPTANVLDVGSLDINGSYRPLIVKRGWRYTGLDVQGGANVDVVASDPFHYPLPDNAFDVVISGSTMEHVTKPWLWIPELARVLKPGGLLAIITHWCFVEHRYPVDCFRYLPDGMRVLFDETKALRDYEIRIANATDIHATAWKVEQRAVERMSSREMVQAFRQSPERNRIGGFADLERAINAK